MSSQRNSEPPGFTTDDTLLDAARDSILAVGWRRTTLTEVARRAGVSRMTLYRRWPDMQTLLADLMTREWGGLALADPFAETTAAKVASGVARAVSALRGNELFAKILHVDPELLLPYLLDRRGRTQDGLLSVLEREIASAQRDGAVRAGDPGLLARSVLLTSYGFALSADTMTGVTTTGDGVALSELDAELRLLVERYLAP